MSDVIIEKKNEVYLKLTCEPHILYEMQPFFTFEVESAKFMPKYRNRKWNGQIKLLNVHTGEIYVGLLSRLIDKLDSYNYTYSFKENKYYGLPFEINEQISREGVRDYMCAISNLSPRDYQIEGVYDALRNNRKVIVSPTSSGKSNLIYTLVRYYTAKQNNTLIILPTTSLVAQIYKDFESYGWNAKKYCHMIYGGREKETNLPVICSTWQSLMNQPDSYFKRFDCVIVDECHGVKSRSITAILTKLRDTKYRFGFTGTLDGIEVNELVLEGLLGPAYKITRTEELMKQGHISQLNIQCMILKHYPPQTFDTYEDEIQYLISHEKRNKFITNLSLSLKGNTLILFSRVETHGQILYEQIQNQKQNDRKVFFVHGGVNTEERELVREITERENDAIIVASYGVFSTGINIKNLHNLIFASPSKSRIRNLQSIGRILRKGNNKNSAVLYDIADDCSNNQSKKNYTLNHLIERIKIYAEENFNYDIINLNLK